MTTKTLLVFLLLGIADYSMTRILLRGSIFFSLRDYFTQRRLHSWIHKKLHELFSCEICMASQTGLWLCALPIMLFYGNPFQPLYTATTLSLPLPAYIVFIIGSWFLSGMIFAGIAMIIWRFTRNKKTPEKPQPKENTFVAEITLESNDAHDNDFGVFHISFIEFVSIMVVSKTTCAHITWCGIERANCRDRITETVVISKILTAAGVTRINKIPDNCKETIINCLFSCIEFTGREIAGRGFCIDSQEALDVMKKNYNKTLATYKVRIETKQQHAY